jgi:chromosomal replication initiation ATPase DnaA
MPAVHDIIKEALDIAFKHLGVESLVQEAVWNKIRNKSKLIKYHTRNVTIINPEEAAAKRIITYKRSLETKVNLKRFTDFEKDILAIICKVHKIEIEDFARFHRERSLVDARFQFAAIFRLQFCYSLPKIGNLLSRDHTSIMHAMKKHKDFYDTISSYKNQYIKVLNTIEEQFPGLLQISLNSNIILVENRLGYGKQRKKVFSEIIIKDKDAKTD